MIPNKKDNKIALMLPGGGARGAYQIGVLKGILQIVNYKYLLLVFMASENLNKSNTKI